MISPLGASWVDETWSRDGWLGEPAATRAPLTRRRRIVLWISAALAAAFALPLALARPSAARDWALDHERPAASDTAGHVLTIRNVRDFRYDSAGRAEPRYYDAVYDLDSIESVWFILTSFSTGSRIPAHTFVSFGFADGRFLGISVEARREADESYGIVKGLLRRYELIYVIGDERDLIGRRAAVEGDATYLYPVRATPEGARDLLLAMVARANRLQAKPEWYNSVFNSCTSNLVDHVNAISPGRIPAGFKVLLPGYADEVAASLGLIDADGDVEAMRRRFRVNERARAALASDSFSLAIRAGR